MNSRNRLVSVIIPTYNRASALGRAITSVLEQTFVDFELIIVDDGSTDNTEDIIRSFKDHRIRFVRHQQNSGVCAARNTGIRAARGEYIAFDDSDDEWLPQKLERQMELFSRDKTTRLGLVTCGAIFVNGNSERQSQPKAHLLNYEDLLYHRGGYGVGTQSLLIKRSVAGQELYFDEGLPALEDWDLALRISRIADIAAVPEPLVRIDRVGGPHLAKGITGINAGHAILQKYASELKARPKMLAYHHERLGLDYYYLGNIRQARSHFKAAVAAYPRRTVTLGYFGFSFFGRFGLRVFITSCRLAGTAKGRTLRVFKSTGHRLLDILYTRRDVNISKLRTNNREIQLKEGWGGKDISFWPPYEFFRAYLNGQREAAARSYYDWYVDLFSRYHAVPKSRGGIYGGDLYKQIVRKYEENNIDFHGDIFYMPEILSGAIKERVDSRFALLEYIKQNGDAAKFDAPIRGKQRDGYIYILNGNHRCAMFKLLGYRTIPEIRIHGVFDDIRDYFRTSRRKRVQTSSL